MVNIHSQDLKNHKWENRILVILTDNSANELYQSQLIQLKLQEIGLMERKLIIYQIKDEKYKIGLGVEGEWKPIESKKLINISKDKNSEFEVVLIGLDGWIKLRQKTALSTEKLFGIIDSMPMRIQELENMKSE